MATDDRHTAVIPGVPGHAPRPTWSVLVPTYNCARYLGETLESVLSQDPGPEAMEIIVLDDHSSDGSEEVARRIGGSRITFIQQPRNVGKVRNYETGLATSRGLLIHQLHGDDRVGAGFYREMESAFDAYPQAGAFFCESIYINENGSSTGMTGLERPTIGIIEGWLDKLVVNQRIQTPSMVVRREVYEAVGGFDRRLEVFEDWEMWIRIACRYPVGFVPQALAEYRVSRGSSTATSAIRGTRLQALRKLMAIVDGYLPPAVVSARGDARNRAQAQYFLQFIPQMIAGRHLKALGRTYLDALSFSRDPRTLYRMLNYTIRWKQLFGS